MGKSVQVFTGDATNKAKNLGGIYNFAFDTMLPQNTPATLVASANVTNYVAPDNGFIWLNGVGGTSFARIINNLNNISAATPATTDDTNIVFPVLKGSSVTTTGAKTAIKVYFVPSSKAIAEQMDLNVDYVNNFTTPGVLPEVRRYRSGRIEVRGIATITVGAQGDGEIAVAFPAGVTMADSYYVPFVCSSEPYFGLGYTSVTPTGFTIRVHNFYTDGTLSNILLAWEVKHKSA